MAGLGYSSSSGCVSVVDGCVRKLWHGMGGTIWWMWMISSEIGSKSWEFLWSTNEGKPPTWWLMMGSCKIVLKCFTHVYCNHCNPETCTQTVRFFGCAPWQDNKKSGDPSWWSPCYRPQCPSQARTAEPRQLPNQRGLQKRSWHGGLPWVTLKSSKIRASLVLGLSKLWDFLSRMVGHLALRFPYVFGLRDMFEWGNPNLSWKLMMESTWCKVVAQHSETPMPLLRNLIYSCEYPVVI